MLQYINSIIEKSINQSIDRLICRNEKVIISIIVDNLKNDDRAQFAGVWRSCNKVVDDSVKAYLSGDKVSERV